LAPTAGGNEANYPATWNGLDYNGEEGSGAILEMVGNSHGHNATGVVGGLEVPMPVEGMGIGDAGMCIH
jgi:hypothetical protein